MATATSTIDVDVPVSVAYEQWNHVESFPHFMDGVESVTARDSVTSHWVMNVAGVKREFDASFTEREPNRVLAWRAHGELKQGGRVEFTPRGDNQTEVSLTLEWEPEGFIENAGALLQVDDALVKTDLRMFKEYVERDRTDGQDLRDEAHRIVDDIDNVGIPPLPPTVAGPNPTM